MAVRIGAIDSIADLVRQYDRCVPVVAGGWNFVHADDPRIDLRRLEEVSGYDPLAVHFERKMSDFVELEQMTPTRRQMSDGVAVSLSRLDRVYARICPAETGELVLRATALGDVLCPSTCCEEPSRPPHGSAPRRAAVPNDGIRGGSYPPRPLAARRPLRLRQVRQHQGLLSGSG